MNINELRTLFPVTQNYVFLNNAAESPLNLRGRQAMDDYLDLCQTAPQSKPSVRSQIRSQLADLFGGQMDEYALVTSTGLGISIIAAGYQWVAGDNVVVPSNEHWNNSFPWQALIEKGVEVRFVQPDEDHRMNPAQVAALTDQNTKIVAVAAVSFNTGFRSDLKKLAAIVHAQGALFVVDGIQGAGIVPINVDEDDIDILCCGGFKWLLGMPGTGFMYVNRKIQDRISPVLPGMFAANLYSKELDYHPDARRFETGSIAYSLFYGWSAGLALLKEIGIQGIYQRILLLTDRIIAGLSEKNIKIITPVDRLSERSAILLFTMGSPEANEALYQTLLERKIIVTLRDGLIRVSPSFFNTEDEINQFLEVL